MPAVEGTMSIRLWGSCNPSRPTGRFIPKRAAEEADPLGPPAYSVPVSRPEKLALSLLRAVLFICPAAAAVANLPVRSCLIDGEAIVRDANGFAVFDLLRLQCTATT
jgi:hypothetical protein